MDSLLFIPIVKSQIESINNLIEDSPYYAEYHNEGYFSFPVSCGGDADNLERQLNDDIFIPNNIEGFFEIEA